MERRVAQVQMLTPKYNHKYIILQNAVTSSVEDTIKIILPSPTNWALNLDSVLKRIPQKFESMSNLAESEWLLVANDTIINKRDPAKFGELLLNQIPPATIKIISKSQTTQITDKLETNKYLKVNYQSASMKWMPSNSSRNNYNDLISKSKTYFNINENRFHFQDIDACKITSDEDLNATWSWLINDNNKEYLDMFVMLNFIVDDLKYNTSADVNDEIDAMINNMEPETIQTLNDVINNVASGLKERVPKGTDFQMNWLRACNGISHEMWPKLASVVKATINDSKIKIESNDMSNHTIDKVIESVKQDKHLPIEETKYLTEFLYRAAVFKPMSTYFYDNELSDTNQIQFKRFQMNTKLLMDIFDIHRVFTFFNFNCMKYTVDKFKHDIEEATKVLGELFVETTHQIHFIL
eukprot:416972_1